MLLNPDRGNFVVLPGFLFRIFRFFFIFGNLYRGPYKAGNLGPYNAGHSVAYEAITHNLVGPITTYMATDPENFGQIFL